MKKKLLFIFFMNVISSYCQTNSDTIFLRDLSKKVTLKITTSNKTEDFTVKTPQQKYNYAPNADYITKLSFNYRFVSFSLKLPTDFITDNYYNPRKGTSKIFAFDINFFTKQWNHYFSYDKVKGYYLTNTADFNNNWDAKTDDYFQFPRLIYESFSGISSYVINPNFSLKFITNQNEKQLKSAGSFIPSIWYKYYTINNKSQVTASISTQKSHDFEIVPEIGYYHTFIINKNIYTSIGSGVGIGYRFTNLITRTIDNRITTNNHNAILQANYQLSIGFDNERFFTGLKLANSLNEDLKKKSSTTTLHNQLNFRVFLGYRFNPPKKVDKFIEDKVLPIVPL